MGKNERERKRERGCVCFKKRNGWERNILIKYNFKYFII